MMPAGAWRATWLMAGLRFRRLANLLGNAKFKPKPGQASRPATPAKRRMGAVFSALIVATMFFSFTTIARQSVVNLECELSIESRCLAVDNRHKERRDEKQAVQALREHGISEPVARALGLQLSLLLMVSFLGALGSREIASTDWDLEWLVTLPVKRTTLLAARIAERSVANPFGLFAMGPPCLMIAWSAGYRWSAPLVGLAGVLALLPIAAVLRTLADTGLRLTLAPSKLRNLQSLCGIASLPFMYLAISFGMTSFGAFTSALARAVPAWVMWTPPGLVVEAITAGTTAHTAGAVLLLLVELAGCLVFGMLVLRHQLRDGVVASGVRESARRSASQARLAKRPAGFWQRLLPRSPVQRRELRLLSRDRNFLVQSLLMPVVTVGSQVLLNGGLDGVSKLATSPTALALTAWGISAYMLMLSALQTLNNEGQVLWMLYTFPRKLESVLKEKAQMWSVLALAFPLVVLALGLGFARHADWRMAGMFVIVLAGVPVFATIAVALGVFACDPLSQDVRTKIRPSYVYLYMLLSSVYAYAIYADKWFQTVAVLVLSACFAQALWQKARDALPYLLDPAAAPVPRVSAADGMMAALLFFVLQALAFLFFTRGLHIENGQAVVLAFPVAGAVVYGMTRLVYWRSKTAGVPVVLAGGTVRVLSWGAGAGIAASMVALAYMHLLRGTHWWSEAAEAGAGLHLATPWLFLLAVLLAPLCEEFIFRGLLFGGLRRSMGLVPAMVMSAGLFAIVHPPVSMLPVFVLGLATAYAHERTRGLLAPMLVHAVYNAVVLAYQ